MHDINQVSYSQWGDDVMVLDFFKDQGGDLIFFEAGANEPKLLSQTFLLEINGWKGILVEPISSCCEALRTERPNSIVFQNALGAPEQRGQLRLCIPGGVTQLTHSFENGFDPAHDDIVIEADFITIQECIEKSGFLKIDFLSLDLEGSELNALRGIDLINLRPRLIIVEDHLDVLDRHVHMRKCGYKLVKRNGANSWYVPNETAFAINLVSWIKLKRKILSRWFRSYYRRFF
jgi:FkbM family methyltransferase